MPSRDISQPSDGPVASSSRSAISAKRFNPYHILLETQERRNQLAKQAKQLSEQLGVYEEFNEYLDDSLFSPDENTAGLRSQILNIEQQQQDLQSRITLMQKLIPDPDSRCSSPDLTDNEAREVYELGGYVVQGPPLDDNGRRKNHFIGYGKRTQSDFVEQQNKKNQPLTRGNLGGVLRGNLDQTNGYQRVPGVGTYTAMTHKEAGQQAHIHTDIDGRSTRTLAQHEQKDERGLSIHAVQAGQQAHIQKDEQGRSIHNRHLHTETDDKNHSLLAIRAGKARAAQRRQGN